MDQLGLPDDQLEKLRQFAEITNSNDYNVAIGTLASLDWNVEQAIETHLMQDHEQDDDPEIIEPTSQPNEPMPILNNAAQSSRGRRRMRTDDVDIQVKRMRLDDDNTGENNHPIFAPFGPRTSQSRFGNNANSGPSRAGPSVSNGNEHNRDDSDEDYMQVDYDEDVYRHIQNDVVASRRNGSVPLIPENCEDVREALQHFVTVFQSRFCSTPASSAFMPQFFTEPLETAIRQAFDNSECSMRRPLAIYIHNEKSIASNIFPTQVLCTEAISSLLRHQYIFWPWDITSDSNFMKLLEWLQILNISDVRQTLQRLSMSSHESFPLIAIIVRDKSTFRLSNICKGVETADAVVEKLMAGIEEYDSIRVREMKEKREREEREKIRNEQEAEYQASLAADRARMEARRREIEDQKAEEERRARAEEEENMRRQTLASMLPSEPAANEQNIVHIKFRLPEGAQELRRFRSNETIQVLINYLSSKGYAPETHKYFNSDFPKKEITTTFDLSKSFRDAKWPLREQVFVEEI
ncbi:unnamed protein product [Caenorhabditis bovis]|uniref:UBX domain-containing protein n=1 Tax=Caenorhabditis bovis TaxID=2654633 RepID=A0A8S1EYQ5_9PELO|nr:unnamed protein product [Caenorhabditis bovis]